jgi:hypothetical protein
LPQSPVIQKPIPKKPPTPTPPAVKPDTKKPEQPKKQEEQPKKIKEPPLPAVYVEELQVSVFYWNHWLKSIRLIVFLKSNKELL